MAALTAGEVTAADAVADIYCRLLGACERATDVRRAEQWIDAARRVVAWGDFVAPTCRLHYGGILTATGRWTEAEAELQAAIRQFERGYRAMGWAAAVRLAALRAAQGRYEEASALLAGHETRPAARRVRAAIALALGEAALAEDLTRLCLEAEPAGSPATAPLLDLLVRALLARGDPEGAAHAADDLAALAAAVPDARAAAAAHLATGRVRAAAGAEGFQASLQAAAAAFTGLGLPLEAAQAQLELARVLAPAARAGAIAEAQLALDAFERLGATADADAAAGLLRALGVTPARARPRGSVEGLTRREQEVLALVAAGLSNPEIAGRLHLSRKTVQHHVAHVLAKLGVANRTEAAARAVRAAADDGAPDRAPR
jgi:DNA-binding NarL/FixJ family response regulator